MTLFCLSSETDTSSCFVGRAPRKYDCRPGLFVLQYLQHGYTRTCCGTHIHCVVMELPRRLGVSTTTTMDSDRRYVFESATDVEVKFWDLSRSRALSYVTRHTSSSLPVYLTDNPWSTTVANCSLQRERGASQCCETTKKVTAHWTIVALCCALLLHHLGACVFCTSNAWRGVCSSLLSIWVVRDSMCFLLVSAANQ